MKTVMEIFAEQINFVHCVFQELETQNVSLPMGDYNQIYGYLEDVRELLSTKKGL